MSQSTCPSPRVVARKRIRPSSRGTCRRASPAPGRRRRSSAPGRSGSSRAARGIRAPGRDRRASGSTQLALPAPAYCFHVSSGEVVLVPRSSAASQARPGNRVMTPSSSACEVRDVEQRELLERPRLADHQLVDRVRAAVRRAEHDEACAWHARHLPPDLGMTRDHRPRDETAHRVGDDAHRLAGRLRFRDGAAQVLGEAIGFLLGRQPPVVRERDHLVRFARGTR